MKAKRFATNPIIRPEMDQSIGANINGPSLIRVPSWIEKPLGRYYLYFAHHQGGYIRLAYADELDGPWQIYTPGTLRLEQTRCYGHIASPDVHLDHDRRRLIMYFHGPTLRRDEAEEEEITRRFPTLGGQRSFVATSQDGLTFTPQTEILGPSYFRVFRWADYFYALGMPGIFYRSKDGLTNFEQGPILFNKNMRHTALRLQGNRLQVFYSIVGDCPEHIVVSFIDLKPNWLDWRETAPVSVLLPETAYEGGALLLAPSVRGAIHESVRQLRDPGIFEEAGRIYLLYSVAGERGLGIAELLEESNPWL